MHLVWTIAIRQSDSIEGTVSLWNLIHQGDEKEMLWRFRFVTAVLTSMAKGEMSPVGLAVFDDGTIALGEIMSIAL